MSAETEARESHILACEAWQGMTGTPEACSSTLDGYRSAVRAARTAEILAIIEEMRRDTHDIGCVYDPDTDTDYCSCWFEPHNAALNALAARVRREG